MADNIPATQRQQSQAESTASGRQKPRLSRMQSIQRMGSRIGRSTKDFFGLDEEKAPQESDKWTQRRLRLLSKGKFSAGIKKKIVSGQDEVDNIFTRQFSVPLAQPYDPLHRPGRAGFDLAETGSMRTTPMSSTSTYYRRRGIQRRKTRKDSVAKLAWDGLNIALGRKKSIRHPRLYSRSFAPASVTSEGLEEEAFSPQILADQADTESLVDDVFFDLKSPSIGVPSPEMHRKDMGTPTTPLPTVTEVPEGTDEVDRGQPPSGWHRGRLVPEGLPSTPGVSQTAVHPLSGVGMKRIAENFILKAMDNSDRRRVGMGFVGRLFKRRFRDRINSEVKEQLDEIHDHRPYFTYWITFVQILVYIVSVSVYGIAPIGFSETSITNTVFQPNLAVQKVSYIEKDNMWIGPRQADLIHLGAKYSPCMRPDKNVIDAIELDKRKERETACCVRNAKEDGCLQLPKKKCSPHLSTWHKWGQDGRIGFPNRTSGSVCGMDPEFCTKPTSVDPHVWEDDITKWPICKESIGLKNDTSVTHPHMTCEIRGRPCCIGIQGECMITTPEDCEFRRGYYHEEAFLCSQVQCMGEICGMIPFLDPEQPDQVYRLWISLFLHAGLFHLIVTIAFQYFVMRDIEKLAGWIRTATIYMVSGIAGSLSSAIFLPYVVEAGPSGSQFGILACLMVEVIQSWQLLEQAWKSMLRLGGIILALFIIGLLPWVDNYAHLIGFFTGFLMSFALLPYVTFGKPDQTRKKIGIALSLITVIALLIVLFLLFYVVPIYECPHCSYFNCIPFTPKFCENQEVVITRSEL